MKKKVAWISGIVAVALAISAGAVVATQTEWSKFKKEEGVVRSVDGELVKVPGEKEKNEIVASIDPITNMPTVKFNEVALNQKQMTTEMKLFTPVNSETFKVDYIKKGEKQIVLGPFDGYYIAYDVPNSNIPIIVFQGQMFWVDLEEGKVSPVLDDVSHGYSIEEVYNTYIENVLPTWGSDPSFDPTGTYMIFNTTRNLIKDRGAHSQMWLKNLKTGEEKPFFDQPLWAIGWDHDGNVYGRTVEKLLKVNLDTGQTETIIDANVTVVSMEYPYLFYKEGGANGVQILNLKDNSKQNFIHQDLNIVTVNRISPSGDMVAFLSHPSTALDYTLFVLDLNTMKAKTLKQNKNLQFESLQWHGKRELLLNTIEKGTVNEITYIINIDDLE